MIRLLVTFLLVVLLLKLLRGLFRSLFGSATTAPRGREQHSPQGEDMVRDPECSTYVPRSRAVSRRVNGRELQFCSDACAQRYAEKNRS